MNIEWIPPNLITLFKENNKVIMLKFVGYHYSTKGIRAKIRFQKYSAEQKNLTSDTGERLQKTLRFLCDFA